MIAPREEKFRPAFYFAMRNTLVTDTLDAATEYIPYLLSMDVLYKLIFHIYCVPLCRLAYASKEKHRIVSLNGELIDVSGTMSGGGSKKAKGGMSSSQPISDSEMKELQV